MSTSGDVPLSSNVADDEVLSIETLNPISAAVAAEQDSRLEVIGIASHESGRVELLVSLRGCDRDPCVFMLNVTRAGREAFERELREKLNDALAAHPQPPTP